MRQPTIKSVLLWLTRQSQRAGSFSCAFGPGRHGERGQSIIIITLALVGLIAFASLVFDGGMAYSQRRLMQNASDAGALAGARALGMGEPDGATDHDIYAAIQNYALTLNKADSFHANYILSTDAAPDGVVGGPVYDDYGIRPGDAVGVQVVVTKTFNTVFGNVIGQPVGTVGSYANAVWGSIIQPLGGLQPLAAKCQITDPNAEGYGINCGFQPFQVYDIWEGGGPGNFGWLSWDNSGNTPNLAAELQPGADLSTYVDPMNICPNGQIRARYNGEQCWVRGDPGVSNAVYVANSLTVQAMAQWVGKDMTIVLWDYAECIHNNCQGGGSNTGYRIWGFATFHVTRVELEHGHVWGIFTGKTYDAPPCIRCAPTSAWSIQLVELPLPTPAPTEPPPPPTDTPRKMPTSTPTETVTGTPPPPLPTETPTQTPTPTQVPLGQICVAVYNDLNGNGKLDVLGGVNEADLLVTGALLTVSQTPLSWQYTTKGIEPHCFPNLVPGTYTVTEKNPDGWTTTNTDLWTVTVLANGSTTLQFLDVLSTPTPTLTATPSKTPTITRTPTATATGTPPTATRTASPTNTRTSTPTITGTPPTATRTLTPTNTPTPSSTPTMTSTPSPICLLPDAPVLTYYPPGTGGGINKNLGWTQVPGAMYYYLFQAPTPNGPWTYFTQTSGLNFVGPIQQSDGPYFFVIAVNSCGSGPASNVVLAY